MLQQLFGRAAVAAADDERGARLRVADGGRVDEVLVVEELVALGGHEAAVEAEELADQGRIPDFAGLERGLAGLEEFHHRRGRSRLRR